MWVWVVGGAWAWDLAPRELTAMARDARPDRPYTIVLDGASVVVNPDGSVVDTVHRVIAVSTVAGVEVWSTVSVGWLPEFEDRPALAARVVGPDGVAHELDPSQFFEATEPGVDPVMVEDTRVLRVVLPQVSVGAVIELEVVRHDHHPLGAAGHAWYVPLRQTDPIARVERTYDVPAELPLRWSIAEPDPAVRVEVSDKRARGRRVVHLEQRDPPAWISTESLPVGVLGAPIFQIGAGGGWGELSARYHAMVEPMFAPTGLDAVLAELRAVPEADRIEAATAIARDRVRYAAIEFGDGRIVPAPPSQVLARGYGDCKDKATLLVALLRALGIEAEVALVATRPAYVPVEFPNARAFDHAIVHLPGDDRWIDPTSRFHRPGELPLQDLGTPALLVRASGGALVTTPTQPLVLRRSTTFDVSNLGGARVEQHSHAEGLMAEFYHAEFGNLPRSEWAAAARDWAVGWFGTDQVEVDMAPEVGPVDFTLTAVEAARSQAVAGEAFVATDVGALLVASPEVFDPGAPAPPADRVLPYELLPRSIALTSDVVFPTGMVWVDPLPDRQWTFGDARLGRVSTVDGARVRVEVTFDSGDGQFTPAEVTALRAAVSTLHAQTELRARHPAWAALTAGDAGGALELLRDPPDRVLRPAHEALLRALALDHLGFHTDAIAELRAATARFPDVALLAATLGEQLAATDPTAARVELERALAIDPDYPPVALASLYAEEGRVDEVLALLAARSDYRITPEEERVREQAGRALVLAGRLDEARDLLLSQPDSPVVAAIRLLQRGEPPQTLDASALALAVALEHPEFDARFPDVASGGLAWLRSDPTEASTPQQAVALLMLRCAAGQPLGAVASKALREVEADLARGCRSQAESAFVPSRSWGGVAALGLLSATVEGHDAIGFVVSAGGVSAFVQRVGDHYQVLSLGSELRGLSSALEGTGPAPAAAARFARSQVPEAAAVDPTDVDHRAVLRAFLDASPTRPPRADRLVGLDPEVVPVAVKACQSAKDWACVVAVTEGVDSWRVARAEALARLGRVPEARGLIGSAPSEERAALVAVVDVAAGDWDASRSSVRALPDADQHRVRSEIVQGLVRAGRTAEAQEELARIPDDQRTLGDWFSEALVALARDDVAAAARVWTAAEQPDSADWAYVQARLAEAYGLVDTARTARARVETAWVRALD